MTYIVTTAVIFIASIAVRARLVFKLFMTIDKLLASFALCAHEPGMQVKGWNIRSLL